MCQIFERIKQAGKPLDIFDIVVAKTFRPRNNGDAGFYLRELFEDFINEIKSEYSNIDDLTLLQMIAVVINNTMPEKNIKNITDRYLNDIQSEYIEEIWNNFKFLIFLIIFYI